MKPKIENEEQVSVSNSVLLYGKFRTLELFLNLIVNFCNAHSYEQMETKIESFCSTFLGNKRIDLSEKN